jgi:two-component system, cell cycle sensor histidine kinase and response regulator CckA
MPGGHPTGEGAATLTTETRMATGRRGRASSRSAAPAASQPDDRLHAAIEQSSDGILVLDADRTITYVNAALLAMSGFTRELLYGRPPSVLFGGPASGGLPSAIERGTAWSGSHPGWRHDGRTFEAEWALTPTLGPDGGLAGLVAVARDRTRERALEAQVARIQRLEALGQLSAGIAHDFNNLLAAILGYAGMLRDAVASNDDAGRDIDEIVAAADRGAALVRQLVAFSRKQITRPEVVDLNLVVSEIAPMLQRLIGEHVHLQMTLDTGVGRVMADPTQLEQVLVNLATNARDAMPGGGRLTIETTNVQLDEVYAGQHAGVRPGRYVLLAVSDTGIGMDADTLSHMFHPFFTTKGPEHGTGLGLATVHGIVTQAGGHVWAYSEIGRGTSFKVYLPRVDRAATPRPVRDSVSAEGGTETILVVEDEPAIRGLMTRVLERAGYRVLTAAEPHTALAMPAAELESVSLLVTDMVMPDLSGPELAAILLDRVQGLRVLCMSGYAEQSAAYQGLGPAVADFIAKPFTADQLLTTIRKLLDVAH